MVGLPYPNMRSPELKEKMDYLNANMVIIFSSNLSLSPFCGSFFISFRVRLHLRVSVSVVKIIVFCS